MLIKKAYCHDDLDGAGGAILFGMYHSNEQRGVIWDVDCSSIRDLSDKVSDDIEIVLSELESQLSIL